MGLYLMQEQLYDHNDRKVLLGRNELYDHKVLLGNKAFQESLELQENLELMDKTEMTELGLLP